MDFFLTYIVPILIVLGLSALLAFSLSFLGSKLKVERDERIDRIREHLPGANCGACGFGGCDSYAEALHKGKTTLDKCKPARPDAKRNIAGILGVTPRMDKSNTAIVFCNGGNECADKGGYQGYGDCRSANLLAGGNKQCDSACMGLGTCVKACEYGAITISKDRGVAVIDSKKCVDCGYCMDACPKLIIGEIPDLSEVYVACSNKCSGKTAASQCKRACIACGLCQKACNFGAIKVSDNLARIDYSKCTACGACVKVCPRKCILTREPYEQ